MSSAVDPEGQILQRGVEQVHDRIPTQPSLVKNTTELADFLVATYPDNGAAREFLARRDKLAATTTRQIPTRNTP